MKKARIIHVNEPRSRQVVDARDDETVSENVETVTLRDAAREAV